MLPDHELVLKRRLARLERDFLFYYGSPKLSRYERWYRLEGIISQTWQSWGQFCRSVVIDSCLGTVASNGRVIARAQPSWIDEGRVSYEVKRAPGSPKAGGRITNLRDEITWGDTRKLVVAVSTLKPANYKELLSGFGGGLTGPNHMQIVRNAAAHINHDNAAEIKRLKAYYFGPSINHPVDLATCSGLHTKDPAYILWITDMRTMASVCVQ